jgi:hypothetical protein
MKISVNQDDSFQLEEVYLPIVLVSDDKEEMSIIMRDSGFEFKYQGDWYMAKNGVVELLKKQDLSGAIKESPDMATAPYKTPDAVDFMGLDPTLQSERGIARDFAPDVDMTENGKLVETILREFISKNLFNDQEKLMELQTEMDNRLEFPVVVHDVESGDGFIHGSVSYHSDGKMRISNFTVTSYLGNVASTDNVDQSI